MKASFGHVRDLPESAGEIPTRSRTSPGAAWASTPTATSRPYYVVPDDKKKNVAELKAALKGASEVLLATDPDREGESISWHLIEVLKPKVPVKRIVFHEITEEAVNEAIEQRARRRRQPRARAGEPPHPRSPLRLHAVAGALEEGADRAERGPRAERRRAAHRRARRRAARVPRGDVLGSRSAAPRRGPRVHRPRSSRLGDAARRHRQGLRRVDRRAEVANARVLSTRRRRALADGARAATCRGRSRAVDAKPGVERPAPPFTTSTLTQEASRKLGFSTERTMQIAQRLFQGMELGNGDIEGLISYHRTDSTTLSDEGARRVGARRFGTCSATTTTTGPRRYADQGEERAGSARGDPADGLPADAAAAGRRSSSRDDLRLYELIWKRTMASQMVDARVLQTTVEISARGGTATAGGLHRVGQGDRVRRLPPRLRRRQRRSGRPSSRSRRPCCRRCTVGERGRPRRMRVRARSWRLGARAQAARDAAAGALHRSLAHQGARAAGIGRPSTYAATIGTIERRGYVFRQGKALVPSFTAFAVTRLLRQHFGDFVDVGFTAEMEEDLDEISRGEREWLDFIQQFYRGDGKHAGSRRHRPEAQRRRVSARSMSATTRTRASRFACASGGTGRSCSRARAARQDRVAAATTGAGGPDRREGRTRCSRQSGGAARARRRSEDRYERLRDQRPLRRLRAARRDAGEATRRTPSRSARR